MPRGDVSPSGYVPMPQEIVLDDRTGQAPIAAELVAPDRTLTVFLSTCLRAEAESDLHATWWAALASQVAGASVTSYCAQLRLAPQWPVTVLPNATGAGDYFIVGLARRAASFQSPPQTAPMRLDETKHNHEVGVLTPAEELRALTRLSPAMLARVFRVSRTTFYKWIEGATPRDERFQHLVDVLAHIKDATQRLPASVDLAAWLRTPISPGAKTPLDYLRDQRFNVFRGLLVRAASAGMGLTPVASALSTRPQGREQRAIERERVSPSPRAEDEE